MARHGVVAIGVVIVTRLLQELELLVCRWHSRTAVKRALTVPDHSSREHHVAPTARVAFGEFAKGPQRPAAPITNVAAADEDTAHRRWTRGGSLGWASMGQMPTS